MLNAFSGNFANMRLSKSILYISCDHIFFNFSITVLRQPLVFELIYERICKNIKKIQPSTSKNPSLLTWGMSWNELEPPRTRLDQLRTDTYTHTHKKILGGYCMCGNIAQRNTTLPDAYLEPSGTSTMELSSYFGQKVPSQMFNWVLNTLLNTNSYCPKELHFRCWQSVPNLALLYVYFK